MLSPAHQQLVDKHAPERLELPGGRRAKITYASDARPFLSARIQDLYGVIDELRIAAGRVPLVIHVLAPNHRPVQVTNNLKTFWVEAYPKLKQQLQRQYPEARMAIAEDDCGDVLTAGISANGRRRRQHRDRLFDSADDCLLEGLIKQIDEVL